MKGRQRLFSWFGGLAVLLVPAGAAAEALRPSQLVRSLQLAQDRLADGDHAALAMQRKLLSMLDEQLRGADEALLAEPREWQAAIIYAMSGGNPDTIEALMPALMAGDGRKAAALGAYNNLRGAHAPARDAFRSIDPAAYPPELGAYVSLVKGSLLASTDAPAALALLDQARLLAPGTLVEEAALRRSVGLAVETGDRARFLRAGAQYARRFLHSPYAGQFADSFVAGVVALREGLDLAAVAGVGAAMDPLRRQVLFLRIARRAAIEHAVALADFAAGQAKGGDANDARSRLYAVLPHVVSLDPVEALAALRAIDPAALTADDRALLQAAERIASGLRSEPAAAPAVLAEAAPDEAISEPVAAARQALEAADRLLETP